ncbi:hypothetical protein [Lentilactobacillus sp. Marseille-Q4993]|uniref:hypothetical protein n=1 Tax=Lentilactobacillus sp. Marseille-Q4993 TaxID=3039492 RepID=UPI0024BCAF24|nr:hypothetical protein [Lentilactobacillus sp. Marseille-Q4993]
MTREERVLRKLEQILINDIKTNSVPEYYDLEDENQIRADAMNDGVKVALYEIGELIKELKGKVVEEDDK